MCVITLFFDILAIYAQNSTLEGGVIEPNRLTFFALFVIILLEKFVCALRNERKTGFKCLFAYTLKECDEGGGLVRERFKRFQVCRTFERCDPT